MSSNGYKNHNLFEMIWGVAMIGISTYIYTTSSSFPLLPGNPVGPGTFPSLVAAILFPCGLFILSVNLFTLYKVKRSNSPSTLSVSANQILLFALVLLVPLSNILLAELLGFALVSTLVTALLMIVMRRGKIVSSFLIASFSVALFSWIFTEYLLVPLPTGTIFQ
ncbi:tripartite tricarboxylate transporter TctB family protein [Vibrio sp. JC009]|uniref:tripartite tricarboxylate transporter TctB family protein n=1 Tax=Vibrio sp. JC009 TaxID=2912314 RepID=UPI0023B0EFD1|nr:tripartite tricarboxylate transporter TctB family protein [Vibrio sp. JC009]WED24934.1 tripartite tricarboxylate transporter TctB family protein [Vibrio sp. JC009]